MKIIVKIMVAACVLFTLGGYAQCTITISPGSSSLCQGDSIKLKATGNNVAGKAIQFDGINDIITRVSTLDTAKRPVNTFTMEAWVKTSASHEIDAQSTAGTGGTSGQKYLFGAMHGGSVNSGMGVSVGTNGISVYEHGDNYMPALAVYSGNIGTGWNHIAIVYKNKIPSIYLNGALVKTGLQSPRAIVYSSIETGGGSYGYFDGMIDEVRIWKTARTPEEISANMSKALNGNEIGLVSYWKMDEGTGTTISDTTGNGNTGTLTNGAVWVNSTVPLYPTFSWSPSTGLSAVIGDSVIAKPGTTVTYTVTAAGGCGSASESTTITVTPLPVALYTGPDSVCDGKSTVLNASGGSSYLWSTGETTASITVNLHTDSLFKVSVSNVCGADSISKNLIVNANPATPTITQNGIVLTSSSAIDNQWYRNDTLLTGATSQTYTATINGNYTVAVTNGSGCSSSSSVHLINTGVQQEKEEINKLSMFPNPSNGKFELSFSILEKGDYKIEVMNSIGQAVYREAINNASGDYFRLIDLTKFSKGVYFLSLKSPGNLIGRKIIIE